MTLVLRLQAIAGTDFLKPGQEEKPDRPTPIEGIQQRRPQKGTRMHRQWTARAAYLILTKSYFLLKQSLSHLLDSLVEGAKCREMSALKADLPILHHDDELVIINKPSGLLVHRTALDRSATEFALQRVRDQIGQLVYPVHRLDRATSGALIFALSKASARTLTENFADGEVKKTYLAVVRGVPQDRILVDYPLKEPLDKKTDALAAKDKPAQSALTEFEVLRTCELSVKVDKYPTSRYALVRAIPKTGRKHQIRRHLHHLGHPIIGDTTYGSGKHNRYFLKAFQSKRMLLACTELTFPHPVSKKKIHVRAPLASEYKDVLEQIEWILAPELLY